MKSLMVMNRASAHHHQQQQQQQQQHLQQSSVPEEMSEPWIRRITSEKAVVVFSSSSCSICHSVKRLLANLGVHPAIVELDQMSGGASVERALQSSFDASGVPSIFIGRHYIGGLDQLIRLHISGQLIPQLKQAGALWL